MIDNRSTVTGLPAWIESRVEVIPSGNQGWFVARVAGLLRMPDSLESPMWSNLSRLGRGIQYAQGGVDLRNALLANIWLESGNEKEAEELRGTIRALLGLGRLNTGENQREMLTLFDGMQVAREKNVVHLSTNVPFDVMEKSFAAFPRR